MLALAGEARHAARRAVVCASLMALGGCSVAAPFTVESSGIGLPQRVAVALPPMPAEGSDQARLAQALQRAFADSSVPVSPDGALVADYAVSVSAAEGGQTASVSATDAASVQWQARPRSARPFDRCQAQRMRATLLLLDRVSGELVYRGEGQAVECTFPDAAFASAAKALVADALKRIAP